MQHAAPTTVARHARVPFTLALLLVPLLIPLLLPLGCSDDDDPSPTRPEGLDTPPILPVPHLANAPILASDDPIAHDARQLISAQRNMISYVARTALGDIGWMNREYWEPDGGACWSKTTRSGDGACSYITKACYRAGSLEFVDILSGTCADFFETRYFNNWTHMRALTDLAAGAGTFVVYARGESEVDRSWTWQIESADPPVGEWYFYDGPNDPAFFEAQLVCSRDADGTEHAEWLWLGSPWKGKWESHVSAEGTVGSMSVHEWVAGNGAFRLLHELSWNGDTGQWKTFDAGGAILNDRSW